jgi:hypothetical protein
MTTFATDHRCGQGGVLTVSPQPASLIARRLIGLLRKKHAVENMYNPVAAQKIHSRDTDVIDQSHPTLRANRQVSAVEAPNRAEPDNLRSQDSTRRDMILEQVGQPCLVLGLEQLFKGSAGSAAKAWSVGPNTVKGPVPFKASARPAAPAALSSVWNEAAPAAVSTTFLRSTASCFVCGAQVIMAIGDQFHIIHNGFMHMPFLMTYYPLVSP